MTTEDRLGIPREPCTMSKVWGVRVQAASQQKQMGPSSPFGLGLLTATWLLHHSAKIPTASTVAWQAIVVTHLRRKNNFLVFSFVKKCHELFNNSKQRSCYRWLLTDPTRAATPKCGSITCFFFCLWCPPSTPNSRKKPNSLYLLRGSHNNGDMPGSLCRFS